MGRLADARYFAEEAGKAETLGELAGLIEGIVREMGFRYFVLGHHVDMKLGRGDVVVIHNYPDSWVEYFETNRLFENDPVVRVSERMNMGFLWSDVPKLIEFTSRDREILTAAKMQGLKNGFTVPFHMPGELPGSFSFATPGKDQLDGEDLLFAQLIGTIAFEAARKINLSGTSDMAVIDPDVRLTDRQRECLILAARGKTDWEIAKILGIKEETASLHLKMARDRYGVAKRLPLAIRAIYDGQISFGEVL